MTKKLELLSSELMAGQERADIKFPPFEINIGVRLSVEKGESTITFHHFFHYPDGRKRVKFPGKIELPVSLFKDEQTVDRFAALVNRTFTKDVPDAVAEEAMLCFFDVIYLALNELEIDSIDMRKQVNAHARETAKLVSKRLDVQRKGKKSKWDRSELAWAVVTALKPLPKSERTLAMGWRVMKERHGERVSDTPDAFRKLLERHNLDWRKLKSGRVF